MNFNTPENKARAEIDRLLIAAGWAIQNRDAIDLFASRGVAVREYQLTTGPADYLLFVNQKVVGVIEAKKVGETLSGYEAQSERYSDGLPPQLKAPHNLCHFCTSAQVRKRGSPAISTRCHAVGEYLPFIDLTH